MFRGLLLGRFEELLGSGQAAAWLWRLDIRDVCGGLLGVSVVPHALRARGEKVAGLGAGKAFGGDKLVEVGGLFVACKLANGSLQHGGWGCHGCGWAEELSDAVRCWRSPPRNDGRVGAVARSIEVLWRCAVVYVHSFSCLCCFVTSKTPVGLHMSMLAHPACRIRHVVCTARW